MKKLIIAATAIVALTIAGSVTAKNNKKDVARNLETFNALYKELNTFYVDSIDPERSIKIAITAMLDDIDPYTEYIPYKEQAEFTSMTTGEYAGIGSFIMERDGNVYISEPQEGAPAQLAGLRPGDMLLVIDNDSVTGWKSSKVSEKLKGQPGTQVKVRVKRPYVSDSILDFTIVRRKIQMPSVPYYGVEKDNIGYIALTSFTDKSPEEVKTALLELKKDPRVKAIALDLRGNGGGLLESAVKIIGLFVPKGTEVLRTRGKSVTQEKVYKTTQPPVDTEIPLAILVDNRTASASEIVSGALQDLDRAVIVGNRSFGKGLVQSTRELPFEGLLKVTIAKYYIPSGRLIQAIDYSHRNPDGSVGRIPDSLTHVFHTANGREVRDGGGITPDVTVTYPEINRLTYNIVQDNWAFDFANKYAACHESIGSPKDFVITDTIYADFKRFIDPARFNYDRVCETMLKELREAAKREGYMNDSTTEAFSHLEKMLKHNLERDLDINRDAISPYLAREIVQRYYFDRGQIANGLKTDAGLDTVSSLLNDTSRYRRLLSPQHSTAKK